MSTQNSIKQKALLKLLSHKSIRNFRLCAIKLLLIYDVREIIHETEMAYETSCNYGCGKKKVGKRNTS